MGVPWAIKHQNTTSVMYSQWVKDLLGSTYWLKNVSVGVAQVCISMACMVNDRDLMSLMT